MVEKHLGKGIDALIGEKGEISPKPEKIQEIDITSIKPNPFQPRETISTSELTSLVVSIRSYGLLQPIVVRKKTDGYYEIAAGERRWQAAKIAGLSKIPVVIIEADDKKMLLVAMMENLQRQDLNPIEKARAVKELVEKMNARQEEIAEALGLDRSTISNLIRLLTAPPEVQEAVSNGLISAGHCLALLGCENPLLQKTLLTKIIREELSIRATEKIIAAIRKRKMSSYLNPQIMELETRLARFFGSKVSIVQKKNNRGKIVINYNSNSHFNEILKKLGLLNNPSM